MRKNRKFICIIFLLTLIIGTNSCKVAQITGDKEKILKIKTVAILPFEKTDSIPQNIVSGCEENFKSSLMKYGIRIIERKKISELFKENELAMNSLQYSDKLVSITGADALLFGQITQYSEEIRDVEYMGFDRDEFGFEITKSIDPETKKEILLEKHKIKDKEHVLNFKLYLRIVCTYTGETLLVMENETSNQSFYERKSTMSLEEYANSTLLAMNDDFGSYLKEIRENK